MMEQSNDTETENIGEEGSEVTSVENQEDASYALSDSGDRELDLFSGNIHNRSQASLSRAISSGQHRRPLTSETRGMSLQVVILFGTLFFAVTTNLPAPFLKEDLLAGKSFSVKDLPAVIYLMVFNSTGFLASMAVIMEFVWRKNLRTILLLLLMCICIVYIILVSKIVPKFSVRLGKFSLPSIALVWSLVLILIFSGIFILSFRKCTSILCQFIQSMWKRITDYRNSCFEDMNA